VLDKTSERLILAVATLTVIASFFVEAAANAPAYAFFCSAIGAVLVSAAWVLSLRGRSGRSEA